MFSFEGTDEVPEEDGTGLDSSMVEHAAVNRGVAGSSPARGAFKTARSLLRFRAPWSSGQDIALSRR